MDKKEIGRIKEYIDAISSWCDIDEAYIFGSSVHGKSIEETDIDLAIFSKIFNEDNYIEYLSRFLILSAENNLNVEPHLFNPEDLEEDFVRHEVIARGIKISPKSV